MGCLEKKLVGLVQEEHFAEHEFLEVVELAFDSLGLELVLVLFLLFIQVLQ